VAVKQHFKALVLAVVALALTVFGVVIAATDANPSSLAKDPLVLDGYPPKTANLLVNVSTGASFGLNANVAVNFDDNRVDAIVRFPLVIATASLRTLGRRVERTLAYDCLQGTGALWRGAGDDQARHRSDYRIY
jgi:hypothetical protein